MRSSNKVFIESQSFFANRRHDEMAGLTDRLCNVIEIKNKEMIQSFLVERSWNQWFLSKKSFCTRRSREKKIFSKIWPQNSWEEGSVKQYGCGGLWRLWGDWKVRKSLLIISEDNFSMIFTKHFMILIKLQKLVWSMYFPYNGKSI